VLFLGAGTHYPPSPPESALYEYKEEDRPPLGTALSKALVKECLNDLDEESRRAVPDDAGLAEAEKQRRIFKRAEEEEQRGKKRAYLEKHIENLQRTSWYYEVYKSRSSLIDKVTAAVDKEKQPSPVVRALAEIDFPIVVTTNYDRLFENALGRVAKTVSPIIYSPETQEVEELMGLPEKNERWLFKIHGCASKPDSIVITDEDYIRFVLRMNDGDRHHPIPMKIRTQLKEWPTLFIGYSLLDYNLRLLFQALRWRLKPVFWQPTYSLDYSPDLLIAATYGVPVAQGARQPFVRFIVEDIWKFVPQFYQEFFGRKMPP